MAYQQGDPVRIHRPNKKMHGLPGRYLPAPDPAFGYVAFHKKKPDELPPADALHRQADYPRTLFPLSQIRPYDNPVNL
jgi:hypothetical protein